jgi:hypothetical protein
MKDAGMSSHSASTVPACTRRDFLVSLLAAGGAALLAGCSPDTQNGSMFAGWSAWLLRPTGNQEAVVRVGRLYLQTYPGDRDSDGLLRQVDQAITAQLRGRAPETATPAQVGEALERAVRSEYTNGQVVTVAGWILSLSEARAYAAVAALAG